MFSLLLLSPAFLETQRCQASNVSFSSCPRLQNLIHNKFFVSLLRQSEVKRWVQSSPVSVSVLRDFYCHSKFLWSSLRKSVSVLSFKASVFCFHLGFISISLLPFNFFEQGIWSCITELFSTVYCWWENFPSLILCFWLTCVPFHSQTMWLLPLGSWTVHPTGKLGLQGFHLLAPQIHLKYFLLLASQPLQMRCLPWGGKGV